MKVKFCGIFNVAEAEMAISLGADYLGFLVGITHLAEDKLTDDEAKRIIDHVDFNNSTPVAVTHLLDGKDVINTLYRLGVKTVQLHDAISVEEINRIKDAIPDCYIIKAIHVENEYSIDQAIYFENYADALLLDSRTKRRLGGTGRIHDWSISKQIVENVSKPVFLAGGLTPKNLKEAIDLVHPFGVDVNSGVEFSNGRKDYSKMSRFISIAKG